MDDTEDVWISAPLDRATPLHQQLRSLDEALRCPICREFFTNPVSLMNCCHSFCSACLRLSLTAQSSLTRQGGPCCPVCRSELDGRRQEANFRPNRSLARLVATFAPLRVSLYHHLTQTMAHNNNNSNNNSSNNSSNNNDEAHNNNNNNRKRSSTSTIKLEPKRRLIYSSQQYKGKRALVDLCREEGISTAGNEQQLRERHQRFVLYWNSHTDCFEDTKTPGAIIAAFNAQEQMRQNTGQDARTKKSIANVFAKAQHAKTDGKNDKGEIDTPKTAFETKLDEGFKALIAQARHKQRWKTVQRQDDQKDDKHDENTQNSQSPAPAVTNDTTSPSEKATPSKNESPPSDANHANHDSTPAISRLQSDDEDVIVIESPPCAAPKQRTTTRTTSIVGPWTCTKCTLVNENRTWSTAKCELCEAPRPKPGPSAARGES